MKLDPNIPVGELLRRYPSTLEVFIRRKMLCIGCPAESFHTIEDAARINGILLTRLIDDLQNTVDTRA